MDYINEFIDMLNGLNGVSVAVRMLLAMVLGGALGLEREQYKRAAGFRTFIIVCVGSTLATMTGIHMHGGALSADATRIPAQIISGMGFLGAGTILVTKNSKVKGLTTAASLWTVACIGIAIGSGFYSGAILGTVMIVLVLTFLKFIERRIYTKSKESQIYVETTCGTTIRKIVKLSREMHIEAYDFGVSSMEEEESKVYVIVFMAKKKDKTQPWEAYIEKICKIENVIYAEEL